LDKGEGRRREGKELRRGGGGEGGRETGKAYHHLHFNLGRGRGKKEREGREGRKGGSRGERGDLPRSLLMPGLAPPPWPRPADCLAPPCEEHRGDRARQCGILKEGGKDGEKGRRNLGLEAENRTYALVYEFVKEGGGEGGRWGRREVGKEGGGEGGRG